MKQTNRQTRPLSTAIGSVGIMVTDASTDYIPLIPSSVTVLRAFMKQYRLEIGL